MTFLNAFLVVFGRKKEQINKSKEIKTLNTLLHGKREEALRRSVNLENVSYFLCIFLRIFF